MYFLSAMGIILFLYKIFSSEIFFTAEELSLLSQSKYNGLLKEPALSWLNPLPILFYKILLPFGIIPTKIFTSLIALATLFYTIKLSDHLRQKYSFLIPLFLFFNPFFTYENIHVTAHVIGTFAVVGALYHLYKQHYFRSSILIGILPLIFAESISLFVIWFVILACIKKPQWVSVALLPIISYLFFMNFHYNINVLDHSYYYYSQSNFMYNNNLLLEIKSFSTNEIYAISPILFLLVFSIFSAKTITMKEHFVAIWFSVILLSFIVFSTFSIVPYQSFSTIIYIVSPFIALSAVHGLENLFLQLTKNIRNSKPIELSFILYLLCIFSIPFILPAQSDQWNEKKLTQGIKILSKEEIPSNSVISNNLLFFWKINKWIERKDPCKKDASSKQEEIVFYLWDKNGLYADTLLHKLKKEWISKWQSPLNELILFQKKQ